MLVTFKNCFNFIETMNNNYHHALLNAMDNADTNIMFSTWVVHVSRKLDENWLQELSLLVLSEGAVYDPPPVRNQAFLRNFVRTNELWKQNVSRNANFNQGSVEHKVFSQIVKTWFDMDIGICIRNTKYVVVSFMTY